MAPTTIDGMKTSTCPFGRDIEKDGGPLNITDLLVRLDGTRYITRQSVHNSASVRKAKQAIRKGFENSIEGKGTSIVEIVSTCNSGWKMTPDDANKWMVENMFPIYPMGDLKDL